MTTLMAAAFAAMVGARLRSLPLAVAISLAMGVVTDVNGDQFDFHATAIADGSRAIAIGTEVTFVVTPGHRGRYEARGLMPLGPLPG